MKHVYFLLLILLIAEFSFATTYYFSPSGNDNVNTGTSMASPWRTIDKLNSVDLNLGDIIMFQGGATFNGSIYFESTDMGTSVQPVIVTSYGTGRAIINGGAVSGLYAENTQGIEIRGINFIAGSGNQAPGIFFYMDRTDIYMDHITIEDVEVSGFNNYGISIGSSETAGTKGFSNVLINRVLSHDNGGGGIISYGGGGAVFNHNNIRVIYSKAYNNKGILGANVNTGNGILLISAENSLIDNCEAYNNGENNTFTGGGPVGIWFAQVRNSIIQNSISHDNKSQTLDGGGFDLDNACQNCTIQYCYSYNNVGAGYLLANYGTAVPFEGNIIRYNISQNDGLSAGRGSIYIWGPTAGAGAIKNCEIYNNTIYIGRTGLLLSDVNFTNVKIKNNILYSPAGTNLLSGSGTIDSTKVHLVQNLYYSPATPVFTWNNVNYNSLAGWKAAAVSQERIGTAQYGVYADPLFNSLGQGSEAYKLNDNSSAINTGLNLINSGPRDFYGGISKVGNFQDIGAYEKQGTVSDNTAPSVPLNLRIVSSAGNSIALDWDDSNDNVGVTAYDVYVGGVKRYTTASSQVIADGLIANTSYTFTVKALDQAGNASGFSAAVTGITTNTSNGLNYRYYEGVWNTLPDFNTLTPVKTGVTPNIDLGVRTAGRNDNFAFVWEGYINITTAGTYTFETISDDGSKLYFNTLYSPTATALVSNDGLHAPAVASGTVNITSPGSYPITITFFEKDGGETMQVYWTGPGIARQLISNAAFTGTPPPADNTAPSVPLNPRIVSSGGNSITLDWDDSNDNVGVTAYDVYVGGVKRYTTASSQIIADGLSANTSYTFTVKALDQAGNASAFSAAVTGTTTNNSSGLNYRYYEGSWNTLPDFNTLTPVKTGVTPNIDLGIRTAGRNDNFAFIWEGYINVSTAGTYTFETISDDGSKLYFNTLYSPTATALVNNDGLHAPASASGTVNISSPGSYPITITFFEKDGGETMQVYWTGPGIARQLISNAAFTGTPPPADNTAPSVPLNSRIVSSGGNSITLDWDDSNDNVGVTAYDVYVGGVKRYTTASSQVIADGLSTNTSYTFTVKALDQAGNASGFSAAVTGTTTNNSNGLNYRYYEGVWNTLPDFNTLTPVKTGVTPNIDLGVRTAGRNDNFAFVWEGYINITTAGTYTFETISDDGSKLYFNTLYSPTATALVNNDGLHAPASASGTVNISSPGSYPITITFFEKDGGETMQVYWTGPGLARQLISNAAFTGTPPPAGLNYRYYEGVWNTLPDFNTLTPVKTGVTPNIDLGVRTAGRNDNFAFVSEGYINITAAGTYTFETISDDGSKFYFNTLYSPTATALVNNDGLHAPATASGTVNISSPGSYPITITFFEKDGGETMQIYWTGPGIARQLIPNSAFTNNTGSPSAGFNNTGIGSDQEAAIKKAETIKAYPNPFAEKLNIQFYNSAASNRVSVSVFDLSGRLLNSRYLGNLATGYTTISMNLSGKQQLLPGMYLVRLYINGIPSKTLKLIKEKQK